ncbi:MAG: 4-(cytidine 5'-diphospho)-2-C-methyl-D-erythritol kinase [Elusimicrobiota bacterium]|nr:4-(cytidine 5'-diphospho)-2-C-methyl-D-erythritol kinase [Elusimicrobiota bacterium]
MIKLKAFAKINLFLEVTRRRADGYHDLATLFARIGVHDRLSFKRTAAPGIKLLVEGGPRGLCGPRDNIVYKAAVEFFKVFGISPAVEIKLKKNIPVGAGLGGGSSDAAAALLGLARLYKLPRAAAGRLMKIAAALGSDVPFFMLGAGMAEGTGRGEKLKVLKPAAGLPHIVLVYPGSPVYTKEVYGSLKLGGASEIHSRLLDFRRLSGLLKKGGFKSGHYAPLFNRLEDPVLPKHRAVRLAREKLLKLGAEAALMSGSGASVFGLCRSRAKAARIAAEMKCIRGYTVFLTKFC